MSKLINHFIIALREKTNNKQQKQTHRQSLPWQEKQKKLLKQFRNEIFNTACITCNCCGGLFHNHLIQKLTKEELIAKGADENVYN